MNTIFKTRKKESFKTRIIRRFINFFPAYRRTGGRVCFISRDWKDVHISLSMNWKTRNLMGSVFGGSIYGSLDPIFMTQLIMILGRGYIVWDKAASIKFIKPVRTRVYARFQIFNKTLDEIKLRVRTDKKCVIELSSRFQDPAGTVYAEVIKKLYVADKEYYNTEKNRNM